MATIYGTNNDFQVPSLDLRFADRKNLVDTISGRNLITFSRNSIGTYVDENGVIQSAASGAARFDHDPVTNESLGLLVEESRTNNFRYSGELDNAYWDLATGLTKTPNNAVSPDGSITALLVTEDTSTGEHVFGKTANVSVSNNCMGIFVKPNGKTRVGFRQSTGAYADVAFDLTGPGSVVFGDGFIEQYPNGWYRITHVRSGTGNKTWFHLLNDTGIAVSYTGDGVSGCWIWGYQKEVGSFPTSYIPTPATFTSRASTATYYDASGVIQTAAIDVARDNAYFPDENGVFRPAGLLLEGSGTNLVTYSEQFDNADWSKLNATVTSNSVSAPDGTTTADTFVESTDGSSSQHYINQNYNVTNGTAYSFSVYAKYATRQWLVLTGNRNGMHANFDLQNGVAGNKGNLVSSRTIQKLPNGWYRCTAVITADSTIGVAFQIYSATSDGTTRTPSYIGTGSNAFYLWGAQLEASSYPTSYIPTTSSTVTRAADVSSSSTVTRAADVASITGSNFSSWYNQSEGTMFVADRGSPSTGTGGKSFCVHGSSTSTFSRLGAYSATQSAFDSFAPGGSQDVNFVTNNTGTLRKHAAGLANNNTSYCLNGVVIGTDTSCQISGRNMDFARIGDNIAASAKLNGTISRLTYYPTRLSNALLQKLTK